MSIHADNLRSIAQNDYMIDQHYLPEGRELNNAADQIEWLEAALGRCTRERDVAHAALAEAARRFVAGDMEGVRLLLCDMNARENAAELVAVTDGKDQNSG